MPRAKWGLATELLSRLRARPVPDACKSDALLACALEIMADDLTFQPNAEMLVWDIARHEGYNIPPYPMAGCGQGREYLTEVGARDVPGWYELRGLTREQAVSLVGSSCLMARNRGFWRKVLFLSAADVGDATRLAPYMVQALAFALGEQTDADDPTLFKC